jgi:molybdate transport system substrate-binding protein
MIRLLNRLLLTVSLLCASLAPARAAPKAPLVMAAASLQEGLAEAAATFAARGHPKPVLSFAASSALARQIALGAPADMFISADQPRMDYVEQRGLIRPSTRIPFLGNRLVLIAPASKPLKVAIRKGVPLLRLLGAEGRLAIADPDAVPAGKYGKAALGRLGVWEAVSPRVVRAENVRAAMALVERGAAPLGIVYETDARASKGVSIAGIFPATSHPPIRYPLAVLNSATTPEAEAFRRFLLSREGRAIFARHGFSGL